MKLCIFLIIVVLDLGSGSRFAKVRHHPRRHHYSSNRRPCKPNNEYYWRDYAGEIPFDAVKAGENSSGEPEEFIEPEVFIGQAFYQDYGLLPASVFSGTTHVVASVNNTSTQIKILCSPHQFNFKWVSTDIENLNNLTATHFVIGGSEAGQTLYIGRISQNDTVVLGKVVKDSELNDGLWVIQDGQETNYKSYEVLTYNCTVGWRGRH